LKRILPIVVTIIALGAVWALVQLNPQATTPSATPTVDPAIYNQVPKTHVYDPGECTAVLNAPAPAYTSNTIGGQPSGDIPAGKYEVGVAAQYSTSLWYGLNNVGSANYINSTSVESTVGECGMGN
jgi:hypothetical protein